MSTFANPAFAAPQPASTSSALELDGVQVRVLEAALSAFFDKAAGSRLDNYIVHINPPEEGVVQVVFEPKQLEGEPEVFGGATGAGPEVNVWVRCDDYSIDRASLAR